MAGSLPVPRRGLTQARWLTLPAEHPDAAVLRSDYRANMLAVARAIGWAADWDTLRARPTIARIVTLSGLSERTVQRWCRWLEHRGLLEVLEPGVTPRYRPGILHRGDPNLAREWALRDPSVEPDDTPPPQVKDLYPEELPPLTQARAREPRQDREQTDRRSAPDSLPRPSPARPAHTWPSNRTPQRRPERLAAAESLRRDHLVLRRLSARELRHMLRPWFAAGFTPGDIRAALARRPDGTEHHHGNRVRKPASWLQARLACWLSPDGTPLASRSQRLAAERERELAEQTRRRAERRTPAGQVAAAGAALARELMADRLAQAPARWRPPGMPSASR